MAKKPRFYRSGNNNVVEFEDGFKIHISKDGITEQEMLMLEVIKEFFTPLSASVDDVKRKVEEIKQKMDREK